MSGLLIPGDYDDWEMIAAASISIPATTASIDEINGQGIYSWSFTNGEILGFLPRQIPHSYKEGTDLIPHIHWCPTTSATYTGTWTLEIIDWLSVVSGAALQSKLTVTQSFNSAMTAWQCQSGNFSANLTGTNRLISSIAAAKLTLALTAGTRCHLLGLDFHHLKDRVGSTGATSK